MSEAWPASSMNLNAVSVCESVSPVVPDFEIAMKRVFGISRVERPRMKERASRLS